MYMVARDSFKHWFKSFLRDLNYPIFPPYRLTVLAPLSFIKQVNSILNMVEIFLTSVASIALLVAGIGIMGIMTVSVMERTREIEYSKPSERKIEQS